MIVVYRNRPEREFVYGRWPALLVPFKPFVTHSTTQIFVLKSYLQHVKSFGKRFLQIYIKFNANALFFFPTKSRQTKTRLFIKTAVIPLYNVLSTILKNFCTWKELFSVANSVFSGMLFKKSGVVVCEVTICRHTAS